MERDSDLAFEGATPPALPLHLTELVRFSNLCLFFFFWRGGAGVGMEYNCFTIVVLVSAVQ